MPNELRLNLRLPAARFVAGGHTRRAGPGAPGVAPSLSTGYAPAAAAPIHRPAVAREQK